MKSKVKDTNRLRFTDYLGTTLMACTEGLAAGLMTSWFMIYLTDYAGIGKWGAILGSSLLLFARLFDAVNDPLEGWIMDRAKVGKHGKYRPFIFCSVILMTIGVSALFFIPSAMSNSPVAISIWVIAAYLIYDVGASFYAPNLVYRTMTLDANQRGRLMIAPRMLGMVMGMVTAALISIVNGVNAGFNNMHTAFGVTVIVLMVGVGVLSTLGTAMVRERYHTVEDEDSSSVRLTDIFKLIKENDALRVRLIDMLFSGFIWTFLFATALYYIKWAFCADLTTGEVDSSLYGLYSLISSMMMFLPLLIGTVIATPLMKKFGSVLKFHRFLILLEFVPCLLLFVLQILGILKSVPVLFFACMAVTAIAIGADFIPGETMNIECMDYEIYKNGKDRSALCNACNKFLNKAQSAVSSGLVGVILVAIGYEVDSVTDTFLGELSAIPSMLNWFIVIMGLVPGVLGLISWIVLKKYPVTNEMREEMRKTLDQK